MSIRFSLDYLLTRYLRGVCDGRKFEIEHDFRDDLAEYLISQGYELETEARVDASPESGNEYWVVDILVKKDENSYVPIELKFNEEDQGEIEEDLEKLSFYKKHYQDVKEGYFILLTNVQSSNFEDYLKQTSYYPFRYMIENI